MNRGNEMFVLIRRSKVTDEQNRKICAIIERLSLIKSCEDISYKYLYRMNGGKVKVKCVSEFLSK